jgi:cytidylate kinase
MAIITISRGSYSHGTEVAEKVAQRLGYACISRDILIEASKDFNIPEIKLFHAIHDAPSLLDRIFFRKEKYIAYIKSAVLGNLKKDNAVYHGFAGHFFVKNIAHVLKVRIIADMEERISIIMKRNGISREEAITIIHRVDEQRRRWSKQLYGVETSDPSLYDLVLNLSQLTLDGAVDIICHKIGSKQFQTTSESQQNIEDLCLAAKVKAFLVDSKPDIQVMSQKGMIRIMTTASAAQKLELKMRTVAETIPGIHNFYFDTIPVKSRPNHQVGL